jgi:hypothetical protein
MLLTPVRFGGGTHPADISHTGRERSARPAPAAAALPALAAIVRREPLFRAGAVSPLRLLWSRVHPTARMLLVACITTWLSKAVTAFLIARFGGS